MRDWEELKGDNEKMPRPSSPLISRDAVVEASLRIIDADGLDAFSLPRLARELSVQTPSLYYHFRDRADILRTVFHQMGIDTTRTYYTPLGRPVPIVDGGKIIPGLV